MADSLKTKNWRHKSGSAILVLVLQCFLGPQALASEWRAIQKNNEGVEFFQTEQGGDAYQAFVEGLAEAPFSPAIRLNLGVTFAQNEEYQKAMKEYVQAHEYASTEELQFYALFNAGEVLGRQKKVPEALSYYQAALELRPDSRETKTNIELLVQQGGGGGGEGDNQEQQPQDGDQENDSDKPMVNRREQKPQPFESQALTKKDVEKILEELTNQEKKVRAKQNEEASKEQPREKDW